MDDATNSGYDFDPSATLTPDDPLRDTSVEQWIAKVKEDHPDIAGQLVSDPAGAVKALADRGVPPPPSQALPFSDPFGNNIDPNSGMPTQSNGTPIQPFQREPYVMDKGPPQKPQVSVPPLSVPPVATPPSTSALDPEENPNPVAPGTVPVPTEKPPQDTDVSAKKKDKSGDAGTSDFAKMLAGLKALQPPANPPVGTPSVRAPVANKSAPDIASLLQLFGQSTPAASPGATLGRLLVAGKA